MPEMKQPRTIEAVVKVTERCNINCSYCYVFNKGDESYKSHPPYMPHDVVEALARFLAEGAKSSQTEAVRIDFHGGEPLMMKKRRFREMCKTFKELIGAEAKLDFALQTNAMLLDDEWIEILDEFQIGVGISLDGYREINDRERLDHQGRSTYERAVAGLQKVLRARDEGLIPYMGVLCVAPHDASGARTYHHFAKELGVPAFDFLLPIDPHDSFNTSTIDGLGRFLCDAFDAWTSDQSPAHVRLFIKTINYFTRGRQFAVDSRAAREGRYQIITVASNGNLGPDDSLRALGLGMFDSHNVKTCSLEDFSRSTRQREILHAENTLPTGCQTCSWKHLCRGGASNGRLINRFSYDNGFDNRSVVCEALKKFYSHAAAYVLKHGLPFDELKSNLLVNAADLGAYDRKCGFSRGAEFGMPRSQRRAIPIAVA
jgi:uncharacterized protein